MTNIALQSSVVETQHNIPKQNPYQEDDFLSQELETITEVTISKGSQSLTVFDPKELMAKAIEHQAKS